jgi:hypothetical protein
MGWVHCRPVALREGPRRPRPALSPLSEELNGWLGDHQTSEERLWPVSPSASTACGNRIALPMDAALGREALLLGLVPEGGEIGRDRTPVTISTLPCGRR